MAITKRRNMWLHLMDKILYILPMNIVALEKHTYCRLVIVCEGYSRPTYGCQYESQSRKVSKLKEMEGVQQIYRALQQLTL
jgi:hypothetical protein